MIQLVQVRGSMNNGRPVMSWCDPPKANTEANGPGGSPCTIAGQLRSDKGREADTRAEAAEEVPAATAGQPQSRHDPPKSDDSPARAEGPALRSMFEEEVLDAAARQ